MSEGNSGGVPACRTASAMPQRRQYSMVRELTVLARGCEIVPSPRSTTMQRMPRLPSSAARPRPTGPAPTISTGNTSRALPSVLLLFALLLVVLRGDFLLIALAFLWNWM